jgi:cell division protein ZapE
VNLLERYEQALHREGRAADPAQRAVAQQLDALDRCLAASPEAGPLRRRLQRWFGEARHPADCRGIYLWGGVGRGKTWLMDLFRSMRPRHECRRLHFAHFMREVHARRERLGRTQRPLERVAGQLARKARVYCLDEFMVQDIGDAMILHAVLDGLLRRGVVLVVTSNTPPARLYEGGLQRERFLPTIALLERMLDVLQIAPGADYRQRQLRATPTWLPGGDAASATRMRELFARLAGSAAVDEATAMLVEGRSIQALRHAGGLAWFDFRALCEGPRSADDYIAIARHQHTVFLSDVPVFDGGNDDAARRFVALIDELYDQRVKLVASAAAEPGELYRGERLAKDFERTASRLAEMRGDSYLSREHLPPDTSSTITAWSPGNATAPRR